MEKAPAFHCPKCDSINFIFRDTCLNCESIFNPKDYENKPTEIDRIIGPLVDSVTPEGYPIKKRAIHILKDSYSTSGKSGVGIIYAIVPDKGNFFTDDILNYDPQKEREKVKTSKLQMWLIWISFIIFCVLSVFITKG